MTRNATFGQCCEPDRRRAGVRAFGRKVERSLLQPNEQSFGSSIRLRGFPFPGRGEKVLSDRALLVGCQETHAAQDQPAGTAIFVPIADKSGRRARRFLANAEGGGFVFVDRRLAAGWVTDEGLDGALGQMRQGYLSFVSQAFKSRPRTHQGHTGTQTPGVLRNVPNPRLPRTSE